MKSSISSIYISVIGNSAWRPEGLVIRINNWLWYSSERTLVISITMPAFNTTDDFIWMGIRYLKIYLVNIASPAAISVASGSQLLRELILFCYPSLGPILSLEGIVFRGLSMCWNLACTKNELCSENMFLLWG